MIRPGINNLLITGAPGVGKTTLAIAAAHSAGAAGFTTAEIRDNSGKRVGFEVTDIEGAQAVMAHVKIKSPHRVGRYGVDVEAFERVGVAALEAALEKNRPVVIDEIGRMELFSKKFGEAVTALMDSSAKVLATIMKKPHPFADAIKTRPDVQLIELTTQNRNEITDMVVKWIRSGKGA